MACLNERRVGRMRKVSGLLVPTGETLSSHGPAWLTV
jgi:hypothetical protein